MKKSAVLRFGRVVGGQALGALIVAVIGGVAGYTYSSPEGIIAGQFLGAALTALDKYLRDQKFY